MRAASEIYIYTLHSNVIGVREFKNLKIIKLNYNLVKNILTQKGNNSFMIG